MIESHDIRQAQADTLSRSNSLRRSNTLIVEDSDLTATDETTPSSRCCGGTG